MYLKASLSIPPTKIWTIDIYIIIQCSPKRPKVPCSRVINGARTILKRRRQWHDIGSGATLANDVKDWGWRQNDVFNSNSQQRWEQRCKEAYNNTWKWRFWPALERRTPPIWNACNSRTKMALGWHRLTGNDAIMASELHHCLETTPLRRLARLKRHYNSAHSPPLGGVVGIQCSETPTTTPRIRVVFSDLQSSTKMPLQGGPPWQERSCMPIKGFDGMGCNVFYKEICIKN